MKLYKRIIAAAAACLVFTAAVGNTALWQKSLNSTGNLNVEAASNGDYNYEITSEGVVITSYIGYNSDVVIPTTIAGKEVVKIDSGAFCYKDIIASVTVPSTVKTIGASAFECCTMMRTLNLSSGLKVIDVTAFTGCSSLTSVTIPDTVQTIGISAFDGCTALNTVNFPSSGSIDVRSTAFLNCPALKTAVLPGCFKTIGEKAFGYVDTDGSTGTPLSGFSIKCYENTVAMDYARNSGISYSFIVDEPVSSESEDSSSIAESSSSEADNSSSIDDSSTSSGSPTGDVGNNEAVDESLVTRGCGDINCDGMLSILDVQYLISYAKSEIEISAAGKKAGLIDNDELITYTDISLLLAAIAGEVKLPAINQEALHR